MAVFKSKTKIVDNPNFIVAPGEYLEVDEEYMSKFSRRDIVQVPAIPEAYKGKVHRVKTIVSRRMPKVKEPEGISVKPILGGFEEIESEFIPGNSEGEDLLKTKAKSKPKTVKLGL